MSRWRGRVVALLCAAGLLGGGAAARAQRDAAAFDMTGTWVSVVTEDWKYRMVTPAAGVYDGIPLTAAARARADAWTPSETGTPDCRAYGAAALMRAPGRLRVDWADDVTLRIAADAGEQTRLLHFGPMARPTTQSLQGVSVARWNYAPGSGPRDGGERSGDLEVVTGALTPGWLRANGVPYGAETVVTEYFDLHAGPNGDEWLIVTIIVEDPENLTRPYVTSANFKRIAGGGWHPTPCR